MARHSPRRGTSRTAGPGPSFAHDEAHTPAAWALAFALLAACGPDAAALSVDLRTDLVPSVEFFAVRTEIWRATPSGSPLASREAAVIASNDWYRGRRVGEFVGLADEDVTVRMTLLGRDGSAVVQRDVRIRLRGSYALTVVMTRNCADVVCPGTGDAPSNTTCVAGRCVDPTCGGTEAMAACAPAECGRDDDCVGAEVACARAVCESGVCLVEPLARICAESEFCDLRSGCRPVGSTPADAAVDASPPDAGVDADAGDAGPHVDAADDATTSDAGACPEGAECDLGDPCVLGRIDCSGAEPRCVVASPAPASTVCRPAAGPCDVEETCGGAMTCPPDELAEAGTVCRAAAGPCDGAERCSGAAAECPADAPAPDGTPCGGGTVCSGGACVPCSSGLPCDTGNPCQLGTLDCSSGSPRCVAGGPAPMGTLCRAAAGPCDVAETCSGSTTVCPTDRFAMGTTCRAAAGPCDVAEACDGTGAACPLDARRPPGSVCRAGGPCDPEERCDGMTVTCPSDVRSPDDTPCGTATCGAFGPCTLRSGCAPTGWQSRACSIPLCRGSMCVGSSVYVEEAMCTPPVAMCPDECCNGDELGDNCREDCGEAPTALAFVDEVLPPLVGGTGPIAGSPFEARCPGDRVLVAIHAGQGADPYFSQFSFGCARLAFRANRLVEPLRWDVVYGHLGGPDVRLGPFPAGPEQPVMTTGCDASEGGLVLGIQGAPDSREPHFAEVGAFCGTPRVLGRTREELRIEIVAARDPEPTVTARGGLPRELASSSCPATHVAIGARGRITAGGVERLGLICARPEILPRL